MNTELIALEVENQRLEEEILRLQLSRKRGARISKTSNTRLERPKYLQMFMNDANDQKANAVKTEIELLKQELEIQRLKRHMKTSATKELLPQPPLSPLPPVEETKPQTPTHTKYFLESNDGLGPAPYDPLAGFVVFYDFILGLDPSYRVCRLVVGLYNGGQEMGNPAPLPPVYCDLASLSTYFPDHRKGNSATLATKQAVPRVRPSPSITLVMELQASGGYDPYGLEVNRLVSRGWVKVDIFDNHNRVISGRWKVPVRVLPIKPSLTTGELNGVPQLEKAELYLRLVNARDTDVQSLSPIDSNNAGLYKYPPLAATRSFIPIDAPLQSYRSQYYYPATQLMYPAFVETVDPPPPDESLIVH
nr:PREDICTED: coiled-coil domain-containing protein 17 [Latimeria chalumnae]|eukprot:XP_014339635.1 PREDICTED: coiled-coil domain-containing protein 17 [Latimeria chalumnae]